MENINENPIKRALLLMKYDNSTTLTENIEKQRLLKEWDLTSCTGKCATVKRILNSCKAVQLPEKGNLEEVSVEAIVKLFRNSFEGWARGTDLEDLETALSQMDNGQANLKDLCDISELYEEKAGESFFEAIDSDIDYEGEWSDIMDAFERAEKRTSAGSESSQSDVQNTPTNADKIQTNFPCLNNPEPDGNFIKFEGIKGGYLYIDIDGKIYNSSKTFMNLIGYCKDGAIRAKRVK